MSSARRRISAALTARRAPGEQVQAGGFAWVAAPRGRVPLLFLMRRPHLLGLTDRRVMLFRRPRRGKALDDGQLVFAAASQELELVALHAARPMLQVRLRSPEAQELVLEFRPRDRPIGRRLAAQISQAHPG